MGRWPDIGDLIETTDFQADFTTARCDRWYHRAYVTFFTVSVVEGRVSCISRSPNFLGSSA